MPGLPLWGLSSKSTCEAIALHFEADYSVLISVMRRKKFGCVLSGRPLARIAFLLLLPTPMALGYTARLVLEDGRPFPAIPTALPAHTGSSCWVNSIGLDGRIVYTGPWDGFELGRRTDVCQAVFLIDHRDPS
jgi:hypothetical protein